MEAENIHPMPQQPVVFMFQPKEFEILPPERLTEWETAMRERVGLGESLRIGQGVAESSYLATLSYPPGSDFAWNDSDVLPAMESG